MKTMLALILVAGMAGCSTPAKRDLVDAYCGMDVATREAFRQAVNDVMVCK